jgi:glycosyltransferase involved in cell wall biosynthesis
MNPMHLAIVSPYPPAITGIGQYGYHVSKALAASGAFSRITLLSAQPRGLHGPSGAPHEPPANVCVERAWHPDHLDIGARVVARLRALRPDLVWFNLGATAFGNSAPANISGLLSPALVRRLGLPSVLTMHEMPELADLQRLRAPGGPFGRFGARWVTWALTQADVVCLTLKRYVDWLSARRPGPRYAHIPIGMYGSPELLPEHAAPALLFFTTLAPFKGLEVLLDAYRLLLERIPNLTLTVAGAEHPRFPGYQARVREQARDLRGVRWLGRVPEAGVRDLFLHSQVVVLPYAAATGSSSVLYQATMWGRPVVASALPELHSAVEESGLRAALFPPGDVPALAASIEHLLRSPAHREEQARWNHQAIGRLSMEQTCHAYLHAFGLAMQSRRRLGHALAPVPQASGIFTEPV